MSLHLDGGGPSRNPMMPRGPEDMMAHVAQAARLIAAARTVFLLQAPTRDTVARLYSELALLSGSLVHTRWVTLAQQANWFTQAMPDALNHLVDQRRPNLVPIAHPEQDWTLYERFDATLYCIGVERPFAAPHRAPLPRSRDHSRSTPNRVPSPGAALATSKLEAPIANARTNYDDDTSARSQPHAGASDSHSLRVATRDGLHTPELEHTKALAGLFGLDEQIAGARAPAIAAAARKWPHSHNTPLESTLESTPKSAPPSDDSRDALEPDEQPESEPRDPPDSDDERITGPSSASANTSSSDDDYKPRRDLTELLPRTPRHQAQGPALTAPELGNDATGQLTWLTAELARLQTQQAPKELRKSTHLHAPAHRVRHTR